MTLKNGETQKNCYIYCGSCNDIRRGHKNMQHFNLVYALSIEERIKVLKNIDKETIDHSKVKNWENRKSLCTRKLFENSLKMRNLSRDDFAIGLQELSTANKERLYEYVKTTEWFKVHNECLSNPEDDWSDLTIKDFSYALRYHMQYISDSINGILETYKENVRIANKEFMLQKYLLELLTISMKVLVADMHTQKQMKKFMGCTAEERFAFYLNLRFGNRENVKKFFCKYPVLARILATRISFQLKNLESFLHALFESKEKIYDVFGVRADSIEIISMGAGDSHGKGKSVIIIETKGKKLVFKYKELQIGEAYNEFLKRFEQYSVSSDFIKIKRIIGKGYTIEEFVDHEECKRVEEIKEYYYKFGEQIAISYMLCVNDLHFENVIAHGKYPVIIDIETMIQNVNPVDTELTAIRKVMYQGTETILGTGLLPSGNFGGDKKGLRLSALNGGAQVLPFKVLKPINDDSDEMKFEYQTHSIKGADNLPHLNGREIRVKNRVNLGRT